MNVDQSSSVTGTAEQGVEGAAGESEDGFVAEIQRMAKDALCLSRKWNVPKTSVFGQCQGHMIQVAVYAADGTNLAGTHAGTKGE